MMKRIAFLLFFSFFITASCLQAAEHSRDYELKRAKLLSYIINHEITTYHYYHRPLDNKISSQAFKLYLKQVDPRKQFFLQKDIDSLSGFKLKLDDEMRSGHLQFPIAADEILKERVKQVQTITTAIFKQGIDLNKVELMQSDAKKIRYCKTIEELRDRWRKDIKYQVVSQYLDIQEMNKAAFKTSKDGKATKIKLKKPAELKKEALEKVRKSDDYLFSRMLKMDNKDSYNRFFSIIVRAVDPHSDFLPPSQKEDFDIHMRGSLEGIGAVLQEDSGYVKVVRIIPGGAAYRQKQLTADDIILMVAQGQKEPVNIAGMRLRDAVSLIRGKKGTTVRLTVKKPDGTIRVISIVRDIVQLKDTFVKAVTIKLPGDGLIGYMKIPSFYRDFKGKRNVTDDTRRALKKLTAQDIKGLIIDLRNDGGGALVDAVKIAGLFIHTGPVVQIRAGHKTDILSDTDPSISYSGPLLILINRFSASASEIFAGAMQDYGRAIIVGSKHSYGKGTVQTMLNLDNQLPSFFGINMSRYQPLGALKLTTQKFYRINGGSTQDRGVVSDIVIPTRFMYSRVGEKYSENAMPWDKIAPASYKKWPSYPFNIKKLRELNARLIKTNKKFIEIVKEADEARDRQQHTMINIDMASRLHERQKMAAIRKAAGDKPYSPYFHDEGYGQGKKAGRITPAQEKKKFLKRLNADPAIQESLDILRRAEKK